MMERELLAARHVATLEQAENHRIAAEEEADIWCARLRNEQRLHQLRDMQIETERLMQVKLRLEIQWLQQEQQENWFLPIW